MSDKKEIKNLKKEIRKIVVTSEKNSNFLLDVKLKRLKILIKRKVI